MADKAQSITDAIKTRLQTIATPTYQTALGANVYVWRPDSFTPEGQLIPGLLEDNELPGIILRDVAEAIDSEGEHAPRNKWDRRRYYEAEVQCSGSTPDDTVRKMISDVIQAIGTDDTWGGLAHQTILSTDGSSGGPTVQMHMAQGNKKYGGGKIRFIVFYRTDKYQNT